MEEKKETGAKRHFFKSKGQRVMLIGIAVSVILCAVLFVVLGVHMKQNSGTAIDHVGEVTMRKASSQLTQRYEAVMEQRLTMVKALEAEYGGANTQEERARMAESAKKRGFEYLAFMVVNEEHIGDEEGGRTMDFLLGDFIVTDLVPFRRSILKGDEKIAVGRQVLEKRADGTSVYGEDIVMCGVPAREHTMPDGTGMSMALVAGFSNQDFIDMLNINSEADQDTSAYIIRRDVLENGESNSFVLSREGMEQYESFSAFFSNEYGKAEGSTDTIIRELNESMKKGEVYSYIIHMEGQHIHMYCNALAKSEWYLVTLTNNFYMDDVIGTLSNQWVTMTVVSVLAVVVALVVVFFIFRYFNKQNLMRLDRAREEAISASKAKSEFLSNMSHDIRTPMNAIVGMTAIATTNIDNKQQVQDCLKKITLSSKHLLGLINDVLDMSKIESGKMTLNMERISLREITDGIAMIVQPQIKLKEQKFDVYIHDIITENVYCDSVRLNQVLLNLLSNAIKYTPEHGSIETLIYQESSPRGDGFVRTHMEVKDTGIGMSPEFVKNVFESFTREDRLRLHKTEGTGLGMTITKYIVDAMQGTIDVESELGKGTKFHVVLDLEKVETAEEEMILPARKMLLVDDDEQLCRSTSASLKEIGIESDWTLSGEEAVKRATGKGKEGDGYDAVLIDWKLPGIDGLETARRLRKQLGDDVVLLLTSAYDWCEMEQEARKAGINGFISKPLFKSTLFYGLRQYMQQEDACKAPTQEKADLGGKHILLAEDNDLNWEIAEMLLTDAGVQVERAENGKICVDMLQASKSGTYDAILMDIRMPVMNGYEATIAIRALDHPDKDIPIVAMTADAFADDMKRCLDCGMNAHIAKPIDMDLLTVTLMKFIG